MIFMTHPKHGAMLLRTVADCEEAKKNGWIESTTEQWLSGKGETPAEPIEEAPKKRGRQPKAEA